ncbi:hypothetical protein KL949_001683 [Ogataea haglerorum]|nr:hypothetical protein KL913_001325 [Ogataea haglerorum]KAG7720811.1 hypothetical protein KL949_001683 [Ogataea haglerorum]KAG7759947.1 hypothetical protein KL947_001577 [Ogataea haglerorum]KAG7770739.1 hypothetical protein KL931_001561 [Ogataea haglerorum]
MSIAYPAVNISYCVKCKWMLRAAWYQQEILQTFSSKAIDENETTLTVNCAMLSPSLVAGTFQVAVKADENADWVVIWDRKEEDGFPDSKLLKQRIRDHLYPELKLSHIDKPNKHGGKLVNRQSPEPGPDDTCIDCKTWEY